MSDKKKTFIGGVLLGVAAAFLVLCGVALFFRNLLRMDMGEGMLLSVPLIALFFFLSSMTGDDSAPDGRKIPGRRG